MTRNDWLVQFLMTLMVVLVVGLALDIGLAMAAGQDAHSPLNSLRPVLPRPLDSLGILLGFVYSLIAFFVMGVFKPKKRRPVKIS